jgi:hypothetical protein
MKISRKIFHTMLGMMNRNKHWTLGMENIKNEWNIEQCQQQIYTLNIKIEVYLHQI